MFGRQLQRTLREMDGKRFSITIEADEDGYFDKQCPAENCLFIFKVEGEDWKNIFKDEAVFCPRCRHQERAECWQTKEQAEFLAAQVRQYVSSKIDKALRDGAREFNRRQKRNRFIRMSLNVKGSVKSFVEVPARTLDAMQLKIQCAECAARFAVVGAAYFCPCCGHNSILRTFNLSMDKIRVKLDNLSTIRNALKAVEGEDRAEITCQSLVESSLMDCVVAFQHLCEALYAKLPSSPSAPQNAFQRLEHGSQLWKSKVNEGYEDWITADPPF